MKESEDSFSNSEIAKAWASWPKPVMGDKGDGPPKFKVELLRSKLLNGHVDRGNHFLAIVCPFYHGLLRIFRIAAYPFGLNHKIKGFVNAFYRYFFGHGVKANPNVVVEAMLEKPYANGINTKK